MKEREAPTERPAKGRHGKYPEKLLIQKMDEYMDSICGLEISRFSFEDFAKYLTGCGMPSNSNYVRHNRVILSHLGQLREQKAGTRQAREAGEDSQAEELARLRRENEKYRSFIETHFIEGVCAHLIARSGDGITPPQLVKPEASKRAIITPKSAPFEEEEPKELMKIYLGKE